MLGLALHITPISTGRLLVYGDAKIANSLTVGDWIGVQLAYGTSNAPSNGNPLVGTLQGVVKQFVSTLTAGHQSVLWLITGLVVNTAYWLDIYVSSINGSPCTLTNVDLAALEI